MKIKINDIKILGKKIKVIRKQHKITQDEFANIINNTQPNLSRIENGKRKITEYEIQLLARYFKLDTNKLFALD